MIVLISSNRCGMVGVGLGELRKGEIELSMKKNTFSRSNHNLVSGVFGDNSRHVMNDISSQAEIMISVT